MSDYRDNYGLEKTSAQMMRERADLLKQFVDDGIKKAKAEVAAEFAARGGMSEQDVRMQCVNLIVSNIHGGQPIDDIVGWSDALARYVLTGKKPGDV